MKIYYQCDSCGEPIDCLEIDQVDEEKLGFDCLNEAERQEMIRYDGAADTMHVRSLCDSCIEALGLADEAPVPAAGCYIH